MGYFRQGKKVKTHQTKHLSTFCYLEVAVWAASSPAVSFLSCFARAMSFQGCKGGWMGHRTSRGEAWRRNGSQAALPLDRSPDPTAHFSHHLRVQYKLATALTSSHRVSGGYETVPRHLPRVVVTRSVFCAVCDTNSIATSIMRRIRRASFILD